MVEGTGFENRQACKGVVGSPDGDVIGQRNGSRCEGQRGLAGIGRAVGGHRRGS